MLVAIIASDRGDVLDPGVLWADPNKFDGLIDRVGCSLEFGLDAAVREVSHPTREFEFDRATAGRFAKPDPLDAPADDHPGPNARHE